MRGLRSFLIVALGLLTIAMRSWTTLAQEEPGNGGPTHWSTYLSIVVLIVTSVSLWILLKSKFPKPHLLSRESSTSINSSSDLDGPYLQIALHLVNPGDVTIYGNDLWLESKGLFDKGDFLVHPTTQIIPPGSVQPRPDWIKYTARLQESRAFSCEGTVEVEIVFSFKSWIWPFSRKVRFSHEIPPRVLHKIGIDIESA